MKLLLKLKFNGSGFSGYQAQPGKRTIQETLTEEISEAFGFPCRITGCSRTDAGVHALGYYITVESVKKEDSEGLFTVPTAKMHRFLRPHISDDISVCGAAAVEDAFHPRYSSKSKEYMYLFRDEITDDPFLDPFSFHLKRKMKDSEIASMDAAAHLLAGTYDFSSFMASGSSITDTVRTVFDAGVGRNSEDLIAFRIKADGYLYNMVRIIAGTLLEVGYGRICAERIPEIIGAHDRNAAGPTAPANGLFLFDVDYGTDLSLRAE